MSSRMTAVGRQRRRFARRPGGIPKAALPPGARPRAVPLPAPARLWPESTVVILATGPSLTKADVDACCGRAKIIAVSNAIFLAPWADLLYSCDHRWWNWNKGVPSYKGPKYALDPTVSRYWKDVTVLKNTGTTGLELNPTGLRTGGNSGYQAINLAVHLGARVILLLGFDMRLGPGGKSHFFGEHPNRIQPPFPAILAKFPSIVHPLAALGINVINCTRSTALTVFPELPLDQALVTYGTPLRVLS